jgi:hypothetical protein
MKEGEYSKYGEIADKEVRKHMKILIEEVKMIIPDVVSIMVIGGLARGEGSFLIEKKTVIPLNDYDVYLITKKRIDFETLKNISENVSKKINKKTNFSFSKASNLMEFYVDLRNMTIDEIKKVEPMLKYFEIRESAKVIYGEDVRKVMPNFSLKDIPLEEGLRFLMNRASLLIESFDINNLRDYNTKKTILYYIGKNYLTFAEALLFLDKKFVVGYEKRAEIFSKCYREDFKELYDILPDLDKRIKFFTDYKLKPSKKLFNQAVTKYWLEARKDMLEVSKYYLKKVYGLNSNSAIEFSRNIGRLNRRFINSYMKIFVKSKFGISLPNWSLSLLSRGGRFYFNYLYYKREELLNKKKNYKILFSNRDINIRMYQLCPLVLFSIEDDFKVNNSLFSEALKGVRKVEKVNILNWEDLRKKYSDLFRVYQFLKS